MHILVDAKNVCYAAHDAQVLRTGSMQTQAIYGALQTLRSTLLVYPGAEPLVLWDGHPKFRYDLFPQYKGNRDAKGDPKKIERRENFERQIPYIRKAWSLLGVKQFYPTHCEADDLAYLFSRRLSSLGRKMVFLTGDQDWLQLLDENAIWDDRVRSRKVTLKTLQEFSGYSSTKNFVQGKALMGDGSDTTPGVGGFGEVGAPTFVEKYGCVYDYVAKAKSGLIKPVGKVHQKLVDSGMEKFERNMNILDMSRAPKEAFLEVKCDPGQFDRAKFLLLCQALCFKSITDIASLWLAPFETQLRKAA